METNGLWNDGRSGPVGGMAGNLVLRKLEKEFGRIAGEKGLLFSTPTHLLLGRSQTKASATREHWFNLGREQFHDLKTEARKRKLKLVFLLVKCVAEDEIDYWRVPGPVIGRVLPRLPVKEDGACMFVICRQADRFLLEEEDITRFHSKLVPRGEDRARLAMAFGRSRAFPNGKRRPARSKTDWTGVELQRVFPVDDELAVVLPTNLVKQVNISAGSLVSATALEGGILLQAVDVVPKLSAEDQEFVDELYARRRPVFEALGE